MSSKLCVFDIEGDGLSPSKIHCLSAAVYSEGEWRLKSTTDYEEMRSFFNSTDILVGHNIILWDIPVIERILDIKINATVIDTLALSWYLYPDRISHGLSKWGEHFDVPKPVIEDWNNQTVEEYIHRCEEDVKINCKLWDKQSSNLLMLYGDKNGANRLIKYLMFKMKTAASAEQSGWKLDVGMCKKGLKDLEKEEAIKEIEIFNAMPKNPVYKTRHYPKKPYKANGQLSFIGKKWVELCDSLGIDPEKKEPIKYIDSYKEPNPNSQIQIKDWLYSLGWEPISFNFSKDKKIPQIRVDKKGEKVLCNSVRELIDKEPAIKALEGITVIKHRIGILKGFLENVDENGYLKASIAGFTNTLRFRHRTIVNLPAASKPYGDLIRGVLTAPEGYELCGSDMSSLEDRTKQHYMWDYDKEYVREMQTPDFDPHLALAEFAKALTPEQVKAHKDGTEDYSQVRHLYKTANYSCTYGAGGSTLARTLKISVSEGESIVKAYREKNWAINAIARDTITKTFMDTMWLWNPVSKLWYSLRHDKDKFSTLNQGTGVYCFDMWIMKFFDKQPQLVGQMHDEVILCLPKGNRDSCKKVLKEAVSKVNEILKLNRDLDIDVQFGDNYAKIH